MPVLGEINLFRLVFLDSGLYSASNFGLGESGVEEAPCPWIRA